MTRAPAASDLLGRSLEEQDRVDALRWSSYHVFFGLDPGRDRPLALHWLLFNRLASGLREDGHPVEMPPFPPLPYPRRMWAGGEVAWSRQPTPESTVHRATTVSRAEVKAGETGSFLLTSLRRLVRDETGEALIDERQDVVFLPASARPGSGPGREPAFEPDWEVACRSGSVDLFRYSALTLNGHRIHYDESYAKEVEGYPDLVVHGPLLASQLMHAAARQRSDAVPTRFTYRAVRPVFRDETYRLIGARCGAPSTEDLAIVGEDGRLRMTAAMTFADRSPPRSA